MTPGAATVAGVPALYATSDLHVTHSGNGSMVDAVRPESPEDWLIVAGDVAERADAVAETLATLKERFATVVWTPGNHELWTTPKDPCQLTGVERYDHLVARCRELGVLTPEDEYPVWPHGPRPLTVAPVFVLYDYTWRPDGLTVRQALEQARAAKVFCTDEYLLRPEPYPSVAQWCADRVACTAERLAAIPDEHGTVLVSHWPLHRHPTEPLRHPEFALWCGTTATEDWHIEYRAEVAVFGHLHIPRTTSADGVRFEEVSLGYPREWGRRSQGAVPLRRIL